MKVKIKAHLIFVVFSCKIEDGWHFLKTEFNTSLYISEQDVVFVAASIFEETFEDVKGYCVFDAETMQLVCIVALTA